MVDTAAIRARAEAASVPDAEQMGNSGLLGYDVDGIPTGIRYAFERVEDYTFLLHARADVLALTDETDRLRAALAFAASCIKSGEPWTPTCEEIIGGALKGAKE